MSRVLGVDYGARRIGLALSDTTRTIASPVGTLTRRAGKRAPWADLERLVQAQEVGEIVVGLPLDLDGEETAWCAETRIFANQLSRRTGIEVSLFDERLTSVYAERVIRASGLRRSQREEKGRVDSAAAAIILRSYLQSRQRGSNDVTS